MPTKKQFTRITELDAEVLLFLLSNARHRIDLQASPPGGSRRKPMPFPLAKWIGSANTITRVRIQRLVNKRLLIRHPLFHESHRLRWGTGYKLSRLGRIVAKHWKDDTPDREARKRAARDRKERELRQHVAILMPLKNWTYVLQVLEHQAKRGDIVNVGGVGTGQQIYAEFAVCLRAARLRKKDDNKAARKKVRKK